MGLAATAAAVVSLATLATRPAAHRAGPRRLLGCLPARTSVELRDETRPAALLRTGDEVSCPVDLGGDARLVFSFGILDGSPEGGFLELEALSDDERLYHRRIYATRRHRWWRVAVPLPPEGARRIGFRVRHVLADGSDYGPTAQPGRRWIALGSPRVEPRRPRHRLVLWISLDTVRADWLTPYGHRRDTTPVFADRAGTWTLFENAVATSSWTLPSLASQFTSRYPSFHGAVLEGRTAAEGLPSVFELLSRAGYTVLGVTGNRFVSASFGLARGFDALWYTDAGADQVNALALDALEEAGDRIVLFVHYMDPHTPYQPPAPFDRALPAPEPGEGRRARRLYEGELLYTDTRIGELLDELEARRLLDDAVVVYSADHGEEFFEHGGWMHSRTLYGEVVRVPLAVSLPGVAPGRFRPPVSGIDIAPTLLDALGIGIPASFQGRSLLPALRGGRLAPLPLFAETERNPDRHHHLAVRLDPFKYYLLRSPGPEARVIREELYDLSRDPGEQQPRDPGEPAAALLRSYALHYLAEARREAPRAQPAVLDPELEAELRALGYLR